MAWIKWSLLWRSACNKLDKNTSCERKRQFYNVCIWNACNAHRWKMSFIDRQLTRCGCMRRAILLSDLTSGIGVQSLIWSSLFVGRFTTWRPTDRRLRLMRLSVADRRASTKRLIVVSLTRCLTCPVPSLRRRRPAVDHLQNEMRFDVYVAQTGNEPWLRVACNADSSNKDDGLSDWTGQRRSSFVIRIGKFISRPAIAPHHNNLLHNVCLKGFERAIWRSRSLIKWLSQQ